ncbi:MAG TPA: PaaX family transcriptional regulator C-terminal domain-containing protein [Acidimicrobiales bacterium]|nr:PaaX family transcriptional regulator C-terminal domain-containing protein [Acidimicrobiales bacterium]
MSNPAPAPLPARSVLLSVLLGSHPPELPVRALVRTAELFGISEGTARVALSRLSADGEVVADGGTYGLTERHLDRQRDQDAALRPATRSWRGAWDLAVMMPEADGRSARRYLDRRRMAELRPGVWARPDNLPAPEPPPPGVLLWNGRPEGQVPAADLAARLWDLPAWAAGAEELVAALQGAAEPAVRLSVAAAMVRLIRSDPLLPPALLPAGWPGSRLRKAYDGYRAELGRLIAGLRDD